MKLLGQETHKEYFLELKVMIKGPDRITRNFDLIIIYDNSDSDDN